MKSRIFNVMQYERHPETGEVLLTEDTIKDALNHRTITRWAYIRHDSDEYSEQDEELNPEHVAGQKKPAHWHIVIEMKNNATEISTIAKWLKIKDNYVNTAKGTGAFLDCVKYLTHEDEKQQAAGKRLYEDECVKANFDFRKTLDQRAEDKLRYGRDLNDLDRIRHKILFEGMHLSELINNRELNLLYQKNYPTLTRDRLQYLANISKAPDYRINIYIEGPAGTGKSIMSMAIARFLVDPEGKFEDEDVFFTTSNSSPVLFSGYDGQPAIVWDDVRAEDLLTSLGKRGNVFQVFNTFTWGKRVKQHVKFGEAGLINKYNIINSVQSFDEFRNILAGEEDVNQVNRRFPFFFVLHKKDYDFYINSGVFEGTQEYGSYKVFKHIKGNMQEIADVCGNNRPLFNKIASKTIKGSFGVMERTLEDKLAKVDNRSEDEIIELFNENGEQDVNSLDGYTELEREKNTGMLVENYNTVETEEDFPDLDLEENEPPEDILNDPCALRYYMNMPN